jgi:hypothetical protein
LRALGAVVVLGALLAAQAADAATIRVAVPSLADPEIAWNLWRHARPDLCRPPQRVDPLRWRLSCHGAPALADRLRQFGAVRVRGDRIDIRTATRWDALPRYLEYLPVGGTSRFRAVSAGPGRIVATRPGLRLEFVRMEPHAAVAAFERGEVDVAPVPLGDIRWTQSRPGLRRSLRLRPLDAVDVVRLDPGLPVAMRRAYWLTADRVDFSLLASDGIGRPAFGLLHGSPRVTPKEVRDARDEIATLPTRAVAVTGEAELASIAVADWRALGLRPLVSARGRSRFVRLTALYPGADGLLRALEPRLPARPLASVDARLRRDATVVPLAWAVGARLVSRRVRGWSQDALGRADYLRVRVTSPRR